MYDLYDFPLYRPPSEAYSLIIQITLGCSHNRCSFCSMYKDKEIFSKKWDYIYSEYILYDYEEKKEYRIDRLMIKDNGNGTGEIYIVDFKTGGKNQNQLDTYRDVLKKNFEELQNYNIKTKFLEFDI